MPLGVNSIKLFNHQRHDYDQPNFLFSSDIPEKVSKMVRRYIQKEEDKENIGSNIDFQINIELNILLTRNKSLRTSDLIKDNMIFVAKSYEETLQNRPKMILNHNNQHLNIFRYISSGLFIINLTLKPLEFVVNNASNSVDIEFLKDESYGILLLSDEQFITQITNYIKRIFITELNKLQENPLILSKEINKTEVSSTKPFSSISKDIALEDSTLNVDSSFVDKSFTYEDDYESSLEELILLKSNDTVQSNEEELMHNEILPDMLNKPDNGVNKNKRFLKELDNLRHNEVSSEVGFDEMFDEAFNEHMKDERNILNQDNKENEFFEDKYMPIDDYMMSPQKLSQRNTRKEDTIPILTNHSSISSLSSPKKTLSERQSYGNFSMINLEDNHGLEYAFKSNTSVPSYIKEDKKFKFIKIGKVQKFVSLFEEQLIESPKSSNITRSSSPLKTIK